MIRIVPGVEQRFVLYGDEAVVFNPHSWETHVFNPAATLVLEFIRQQPRTNDEVIELLGESLVESEREAASDHVHALIGELVGLGLLTEEPTDNAQATERATDR